MTVHGAPMITSDVCDTPECRLAAAEIRKDMNPNADPCIDFSQYTCGAYYKDAVIPKYSSAIGNAQSLQQQNNDLIRSIATPGDPKSPKFSGNEAVNKRNLDRIQNYYVSCMDEAQQNKVGRQPLVNEIQQLIQLYSVQDSDLVKHAGKKRAILPEANRRALSTVIGQYLKNGIDTFFSFYVGSINSDPDHNYLNIAQSGLGLNSDQYIDPKTRAKYETLVGAG
ncbi:hypothetical protein BGX26_006220, partial [Mortierella sp. AD094]